MNLAVCVVSECVVVELGLQRQLVCVKINVEHYLLIFRPVN